MIAYLPPLLTGSRRAADLVLRVDEATSRFDRGQFVRLAHRLYRGDRRWTPPLGPARLFALRADRNPLLGGQDLGAFLGVGQNLGLGDEAAATLAAWPSRGDREVQETTWGSWGMFESINHPETPERLFYEAENWLFEHTPGISGIRGPMAIEPLVSPGLLTDGFDARPAAFLPYNPPFYPEMVESQGYEAAPTWRAYSVALSSPSRAGPKPQSRAPATGEWFNVLAAYGQDNEETPGGLQLVSGLVQWLADLACQQSFPVHWTWRWAARSAFRQAIVVTAGEEEPAACFGVPDLARALRASRGRLLPLGWLFFEIALRRTRQLRVFPGVAPGSWDATKLADLYEELARRAGEAGYCELVIAPIPDDDRRGVEALAILGAHPAQQFTVYEKRF